MMRRLAAGARALVALGLLTGLLVGVPGVLLAWGQWPIGGWPSWNEVGDLPATAVSDDGVLALVTVLLWASWLVFVVSLVAEVVAQVRGLGRMPLRLGGPLQRLASYLVGSLAMSTGMLGASSPAILPLVVAVAPPTSAVSVAADGLQTPASVDAGDTITVQHGDTAWALAARHLGDGARWREMWELNQNRAQPGGATWSDPEHGVQPGWHLVLPAQPAPAETEPTVPPFPAAPGDPAATPAQQPQADPAAPPTQQPPGDPAATPAQEPPADVVVQPGDNFWDLAEGELAAAWRRQPADGEVVSFWHTYVDQNRERLAPPHDPNLIYPGQVFAEPSPPVDPSGPAPGPATPPAPSEVAPTPSPAPSNPSLPPTEEGAGPEQPASPSSQPSNGHAGDPPEVTIPDIAEDGPPVPVPSTEPATEEGAEPEGTGILPEQATADDTAPPSAGGEPEASDEDAGASREDSPPSTDDEGDDAASRPPIGLIGGGVVLAGVVVLLERRRRAQQRHRGKGRRIAMPEAGLAQGEVEAQSGSDVDGAQLLDRVLRAAAVASGMGGLPPLRWVEMTSSSVQLVFESPAPPPRGFTAPAPDRWLAGTLPDALVAEAERATVPAPTLVPLGTTSEGTELLLELESSAVVTVAGPQDKVAGLLRALAIAAALPPWSEYADVLLVGMPGAATRDLEWVHQTATLAEALDAADDRADRVDAALRSLHCTTVAQARAARAAPDWHPLVVVSALPPNDVAERQRLAELSHRQRRSVAVVVPVADHVLPVGRRLMIANDGWLHIDGVDMAVQGRYLDGEDVDVVASLLDVATRRTDVAVGEGPDVAPVRRPSTEGRPDATDARETPFREQPLPEATPSVASGPGGPPRLPTSGPRSTPPGDDSTPPPGATTPPATSPQPMETLLADIEVLVRVLGEVEAVRRTGPSSEERLVPRRQKGLEAIAYLALRETRVDREDLESKLFPAGRNVAKTVYNNISAARALLGDDLFPPPSGGGYELSSKVVTDYGLFCELVDQAELIEDASVAAGLLGEALDLVRGEPFTGVGRGYAWVGPHRGMIVAQVVDAAEELAEIRLATGDWRGAEWAARQGLLAFPSDERMYRLLMRAAKAAGNVPGVVRVFQELCEVVADPDHGVEPEDTIHPETVQLLEDLTGRAHASQR